MYESAKWIDGVSIEVGDVSLSQVGDGDVDFWWRCFCDDGRISHARERVLILSKNLLGKVTRMGLNTWV